MFRVSLRLSSSRHPPIALGSGSMSTVVLAEVESNRHAVGQRN